jgi:hypothetical protein
VKYVEDDCCGITEYVRPTRAIRGEAEVKERKIERPESRILMLKRKLRTFDVSARLPSHAVEASIKVR